MIIITTIRLGNNGFVITIIDIVFFIAIIVIVRNIFRSSNIYIVIIKNVCHYSYNFIFLLFYCSH